MNRYLFTPGPVPLPQDIMQANGSDIRSHREPGFFELMDNIQSGLQELMKTQLPVILLPSSGTGALEALCANFLQPGQKVISVSCGEFGSRFREIARCAGADIIPLDFAPGEPVSPESVFDVVKNFPEARAILLTHNETSTGVLNPVGEIMEGLPEDRPLVFLDSVSSLGAAPCYPEHWNIDGLASCSQKGLLTPPGIGLVWLSSRAWKMLKDSRYEQRSYYFDLVLHRKYLDKKESQNPFTPPVSLLGILERSLRIILDTGPEKWFAKKKRISRSFMAGIIAMGAEPLVKQKSSRSPGVSAVILGQYSEPARKDLLEMGIVASGGQGDLKGSVLRFAHYADMGWPEICLLLGSLFAVLKNSGFNPDPGYITNALKTWEEGDVE